MKSDTIVVVRDTPQGTEFLINGDGDTQLPGRWSREFPDAESFSLSVAKHVAKVNAAKAVVNYGNADEKVLADFQPVSVKAFQIIGGVKSPSAIVFGATADEAKAKYNDWLYLTYGRRDDGVGVSLMDTEAICLIERGTSSYAPGVKGPRDLAFDLEAQNEPGWVVVDTDVRKIVHVGVRIECETMTEHENDKVIDNGGTACYEAMTEAKAHEEGYVQS